MSDEVSEGRVDDVARAASHARLEAWFRADADRVLAYLLHRTDAHTAQDVLQEVFVTAYRRMDDVPEPPIGWLIATARRTLANVTRGDRRRERLALRVANETATQVAPTIDTDGDDDVTAALRRLAPADREVLAMSAWYGLSGDEAAAALDCSPAAYRVRLHRARRRLSELLAAAGHPRAVAEGGAS